MERKLKSLSGKKAKKYFFPGKLKLVKNVSIFFPPLPTFEECEPTVVQYENHKIDFY